jgi:hypothetical protein
VGVTQGLPETARRELLDEIYSGELPRVNSLEYMEAWGTPASATRLRKMADSIATFARNAKRRASPSLVAISEWEGDLGYLRKTYYAGKYDFKWPKLGAV